MIWRLSLSIQLTIFGSLHNNWYHSRVVLGFLGWLTSYLCWCYQIVCFDRYGCLRDVLNHYAEDGDAERAYDELVSGNWSKTFFMGKSKKQVSAFKEHVSMHVEVTCIPLGSMDLLRLLFLSLLMLTIWKFVYAVCSISSYVRPWCWNWSYSLQSLLYWDLWSKNCCDKRMVSCEPMWIRAPSV